MSFFLSVYQLVNAQIPKKWIVKTDAVENEILLKKLAVTQSIENDSVYRLEEVQLEKKLNEFGYFSPDIFSVSTDSTIITNIILNRKIDYLRFYYDDLEQVSNIFSVKSIEKNVGEIPIEKTTEFLNSLTKFYQNNGYPFVKIYLTEHQIHENFLSTKLIVEKSESRIINKIIVNGYPDFPKKFLKNKLQLSESQIFDKSKIENLSKKISYLPFVSEIRNPEILFTKDSTYIYLYLEKLKNNSVDGIVGFSSSENQKGLKFNGHLNLNLLNVLDKGEKFSLNWLSDGSNSQSLQTGLEIPYFAGSPFILKYGLDMYKKDTLYFSMQNKLGISYEINDNSELGFEYNHLNSNIIESNSENNYSDIHNNFIGISYQFSLQNPDKLFPLKFSLENIFLSGKRNSSQQWKYEMKLTYLIKINERKYIQIDNQTALLISDKYFDNELFRIGGAKTIRGFQEQSIQAEKYNYFNLGYHYITSQNSYFSILSDVGYVKSNTKNYIVYSYGLGYTFGYDSGLFKIQYFIANTSNEKFSLKNSFLHVNFTQNF